ncbi:MULTISPECIES: hypothetical protein [Mesorhizobium]|uniref:hypothetical protein n=2 Tax=Phyllobacteriaceae TaxID=69277 RepID=UPI0007A9546E|nr:MULTISPECIES: hypothetical protein [Mesorhizobium]AMX97847.1 hypothetical protein A4R28_32165 [Mesorhizobium ciceri]MDF3233876.1 hypothetical protein [Mesorhizobium sp. DSM 30133]RUU16445.1 hypothetical protein EOC84_29075 [Mesorhizobium sp. Primo-B]RUU34491.1 hypothetical protein EOC83_28870 [Mesorhizobium sp. Primo-A]RVB81153.1 hypothetical protein EN880_33535 [Mesorhizobium sp. M7A.F.Ca.AU.002.03.1.1]
MGDNKLGAVFAFKTERGQAPASLDPFLFESIDEKIAEALGVTVKSLVMNGMAIHPVTREPYLSVGVRNGDRLEPAVVSVSLSGEVRPFDLSSSKRTVHRLTDVPDEDKTFKSRAGSFPYPPAAVFDEKARTPLRSMTIVDLKFHNGDVFVAGVSNQEFSSTLRRIPYPFTGAASETQVEIYHLAHGHYETRAPIRTMQFATINGEDTLVAAYACSPLVTIPVSDLKHGAKVRGKTIGDMGNGQPISMVAFRDGDEDKLFITNLSRGPMIVPLSGIRSAEGYTPENRPTQDKMLDQHPTMPAGPVGKQVLFVGSSLRADLFSDRFFVSLTRYADTGDLTLETLMTSPLPGRLDKIWVEFDFPGAQFPPKPSA